MPLADCCASSPSLTVISDTEESAPSAIAATESPSLKRILGDPTYSVGAEQVINYR